MQIDKIKDTFKVRCINNDYVSTLATTFKTTGYENAYPVSITSDGVLWDGNHRLAAAIKLGWSEIPHIIETPDNIRLAAHNRNKAATNSLPETLVDHAEEIWAMLESGKTQQQVADEIGWSREKVKNYASLEKISPVGWKEIGTEFQKTVPINENDSVPKNGTTVPITENLLRNILNLTEHHQNKIISDLVSGKIKPGQVKNLASTYAERETFAEHAIEYLINKDDIPGFFKDCIEGLYSSIDKLDKAISQANDEFEKSNSIRILNGDCLELMKNIPDESCDTLITDPPYFILDEKWDQFKDQNKFIEFSREWIHLATSKIKSTGRIYIFWSQRFMFDFPFDAISDRFKFGNMLIWNYKNNIKPNNQKIYKHTYEPCFYFYGIESTNLNLPKNASWDKDMNDYDVFEYAQPQSNFTDKKEHPSQKPEKLINQLVTLGSDIGDTVLDCFAGSGTTGVSCKNLKRKAILIEKDQEYIKIINKRIMNAG